MYEMLKRSVKLIDIALAIALVIILTFSMAVYSSAREVMSHKRDPVYGLDVNFLINDGSFDKDEYIKFYTEFTNSKEISSSIVKWSLHYDVPVHLAFAIAYTENSGFVADSISRKNTNGTRDWGLFQLNDGFRESWSKFDFFNIDKNAKEGIAHYAFSYGYFLGKGKDISFTFLGYNMGVSGASRHKTIPKNRVGYVNSILAYEKLLDDAFNERFNI